MNAPWATTPTDRGVTMVAGAAPESYWLDRPERPAPRTRHTGSTAADLVIVGGGFTGLWAALHAAEENPNRSIVLLEGDRIAEGATGRNGGFCAASLTHGLGNGLDRYADELPELLRMGTETLDAICATADRYGIDADIERTGELDIANFDWQVDDLRELGDEGRRLAQPMEYLDAAAVQSRITSPMARGALFDPDVAMIDPAKLAWGLADAAESLGVRIHENTRALSIGKSGTGIRVKTGYGTIEAGKVLLATSASKSLRRKLRHWIVPVWDYVIMTEPLTSAQLADIGWSGREGLADSGNRFHYFRLTADNRILFGGWDAHYFYGGDTDPRRTQHPEEFALLAEHLLQMFPSLEGIRATHAWGGSIDTCSRFSAFWDLGMNGRVASIAGFTGLGVGASHFGARTALDLLDGKDTERTRLKMVRSMPLPFPPEPLKSIGINITRAAFARADRNGGKRGLWLKGMDALGLGFDS
ncbi:MULTISPECIES: NAD(P)/FAD-dependent oxidoreductase [unclassified Rhodococcus (in: high G+C Gram-positive bacteria)]|uniref:NAD(P)/FAD-dependent oxidoreductase n=1 Tax=unclassified Rhodococcus (in: high G+C Gram-positive bacteria) TaxID=192944 RepID=UPI0007BAF7D5|nr:MULTISPECIES: FAD-dependent oxidoreductase [unclassified Rhodococcus (in: high G+C Gram-positive bacteria)]KZF02047.1 FAD-dependent oxidoreductase [Rhodococcus sp. EPR-147]KZF06540.1 FAD-dependent oxidoreductase [Rhodococcus sp. EPR-279]